MLDISNRILNILESKSLPMYSKEIAEELRQYGYNTGVCGALGSLFKKGLISEYYIDTKEGFIIENDPINPMGSGKMFGLPNGYKYLHYLKEKTR